MVEQADVLTYCCQRLDREELVTRHTLRRNSCSERQEVSAAVMVAWYVPGCASYQGENSKHKRACSVDCADVLTYHLAFEGDSVLEILDFHIISVVVYGFLMCDVFQRSVFAA